ncbi:MAG: ATP-binding protein [Nitrospirota bacterium]
MERRLTRTRTRWGLKGRLVSLTLVVGTVPLVLGIGTAYLQGTRELHATIGANFAGLATESARKLDLVVHDEVARLTQVAQDRLIVDALIERAGEATPDRDEAARREAREAALRRLTDGPVAGRLRQYLPAQDPGHPVTQALLVTDASGRLVASTSAAVRYAFEREPWWRKAMADGAGRAHVGNVTFDAALNTHVFHVSVPVANGRRGRPIGVVHRMFDAKAYFAPYVSPIRFGKTGHVMLIDSAGTVMSCPVLPTGTHLADAELVSLVTPPYGGWDNTPSDGHGGHASSLVGFSPLADTNRFTLASTGTSWHTFVWQSTDELFAPTRRLLAWVAGIGLAAIALLGALGYVAAVRIVRPIRRLQQGAALIGRNELTEPIVVRTGDEIQGLAEEINRMNSRLQDAFSGLNQEVRSLQASNEQILNSVPNPIVMLDQERVQYVNRAARRAFGLNDRCERGLEVFDLIAVDERSRDRLRGELRACDASRPWSTGDADVSSPSSSPGDPLGPRRATDADPCGKELTINRVTYRYEIFRIDAPANDSGRIGLVLWDTTLDSQRQAQLIQAEKLAGLGVLTSGIGHELNNPLFGILSLSEAIRDERDPGRVRSHANEIVTTAKRMARIIRDFAGSSRSDQTELRDDVNVNEQLDLALRVVGLIHEATGLHVRRRYQPARPIRAVPGEIGQVFVSVITNAIQAMKGKGVIDLCTETAADAVTVTIRDQGPGVPIAHASRIFDPFFTTKAPGQGTGLGLTMARRILMRCGGQIRLDNPGGPGATFVLTFPTSRPESSDSGDVATHVHLNPPVSAP